MDLTNISDLHTAMRLAGIKATKGLGQHFLVNKESLQAVLEAGEIRNSDTILEIGPGLGVMTIPLTKMAKQVIAIETDSVLSELLERRRPENLKIIQGDILQMDLSVVPKGYKVVANLPYYLTSKIFRLLLESPHQPKLISVLVQKEVANRIIAAPGSMSVLAFSIQYYGKPIVTAEVDRNKFWPPPKVDSAVLKIEVFDKPIFAADRGKLFRLVKAGFGEKRKMLKNSLAGGLNISMDLAIQAISAAKIPANARAQELSMDDWNRLYQVFESQNYL